MFIKFAFVKTVAIALLIGTVTIASASVETSPEVSLYKTPIKTQIAEARKALPKECLIGALVEALEKGNAKCEISKELKDISGFPIVTTWEVVTQSLFFSMGKGFTLREKKTSRESKKDQILTFFRIFVPMLGVLIVSILNVANRERRVHLLVFYGAFFGSVCISALAGGISGMFAGLFAGGIVGGISGIFTGGIAGLFAGGIVGGISGMFAGVFAGGFASKIGWESAGTSEYLVLLVAVCVVSFAVREILAALLARRAR